MNTLKYLINFEGKITLVAHKNPDADCVGSMLALYQVLKKFNKDVIMISKDEPPETINYLNYFYEIKKFNEIPKSDLYVLIDLSEVDRSGFEINNKNIIKIDHHISSVRYSDYDFVDDKAPSTTSLILKIIREYDENLIDENIAECIYIGLIGDTGSFSYSNLKVAFECAYYLANRGFDLVKFSEKFSRNQTINRMKLIQLALSTLKQEGEIAYVIIRKEFYEISGAKKYENFGIVDYPLSLKGVKVALKFEEIENNKWKINLRSKSGINVEPFARKNNGGGHKNASAFIKSGNEDEVINEVISDLRKYLKMISAH